MLISYWSSYLFSSDLILRAIDMPVIDDRGPDFQKLGRRVLAGMNSIFKCAGPVIIYLASGTGAWEAALVNVLNAGDKGVLVETGHFATVWKGADRRRGRKEGVGTCRPRWGP